MDTVTMGSPLSLAVVANYFMENLNEEAISEEPMHSTAGFSTQTFIIWPQWLKN
jgi:hypothetical protein